MEPKRYLKITLAYDGSDYVGWQVQPNGVSIQQRMEEAWKRVTGESLRITASGRTDAGVHAEGQVCSLSTHSHLDGETLVRALNANLPQDIAVLHVMEAADGFHAIRDAVQKTYRYQIQTGPIRDVLQRRYRWHVPRPVDLEAVRQAANRLVGQHDFASFQSAGADRKTTVRTVSALDVEERRQEPFIYLNLEITADGFLYNMVRNIVGTLMVVGQGREPVGWIDQILAARDRRRAGPTAPPQGLFLIRVDYSRAVD